MSEHQHAPDLSSDELRAVEERWLCEAEAQIEQGDYVTLEAMMAWVDSLGTERELPPPEPTRRAEPQQL